jgi:hypothetical protein
MYWQTPELTVIENPLLAGTSKDSSVGTKRVVPESSTLTSQEPSVISMSSGASEANL